MKWMTYLQQFHLMIKYKKGSHNKLADMLSRPPVTALCLSVFMQVQPTLHEEYIDWKIHHEVEQQLQKAQQKYKERHDRHHIQGNFQEGDLVWLHLGKDRLLGEGKKLRPIRYRRRGARESFRIGRKGQRQSGTKWFSREAGQAQFPHLQF
ncbi:hypothetical protein NC651_018101 [Populus alba x Populus x berolinensis]|nr:hypothetical protein NC651_018101 [Populus alba x Populus x berolinensis]